MRIYAGAVASVAVQLCLFEYLFGKNQNWPAVCARWYCCFGSPFGVNFTYFKQKPKTNPKSAFVFAFVLFLGHQYTRTLLVFRRLRLCACFASALCYALADGAAHAWLAGCACLFAATRFFALQESLLLP